MSLFGAIPESAGDPVIGILTRFRERQHFCALSQPRAFFTEVFKTVLSQSYECRRPSCIPRAIARRRSSRARRSIGAPIARAMVNLIAAITSFVHTSYAECSS